MTIYDLTNEYIQLLEMASDPEVDPDVLADTMEGLEGEIEDKADGYAKVIRQIEADAAAIKEEIGRLQERKGHLENSIARMKNALQTAMEVTGKTKFKTALFSFGIQKNPASVVLDTEEVPEEYLVYQAPKVDRGKIKEDLKAGKDLTGIAHLEQGESLRIR